MSVSPGYAAPMGAFQQPPPSRDSLAVSGPQRRALWRGMGAGCVPRTGAVWVFLQPLLSSDVDCVSSRGTGADSAPTRSRVPTAIYLVHGLPDHSVLCKQPPRHVHCPTGDLGSAHTLFTGLITKALLTPTVYTGLHSDWLGPGTHWLVNIWNIVAGFLPLVLIFENPTI